MEMKWFRPQKNLFIKSNIYLRDFHKKSLKMWAGFDNDALYIRCIKPNDRMEPFKCDFYFILFYFI